MQIKGTFRLPAIRFRRPAPRAWSNALLVLLATIVLCYLSLYNGFPFFYSDTGTYLWSGFREYRPPDRPLIYGLFMRYASLRTSLWLVVFAQSWAIAVLLFWCFKHFAGKTNYRLYYIAYVFVITFFTGVSINTGQLIPDVFAAVGILCIALLLFAPGLKKIETLVVSSLFVLSVGVHNSHFLIATIILLVFLTAFIFRKSRNALRNAGMKLRRAVYGLLLVVAAYYGVCTIHYENRMGYQVSSHGYIFVMARLYDCGILEQYLADACPERHYRLCDYQAKFPWDFIWDYENSPLYKTGGWDVNRDEYNEIIHDILTTPKYWPRLIARETEATVRQFFSFITGDTNPQEEGSSVIQSMQSIWPENMKEFRQSLQQNRGLDWRMLNLFHSYLIGFLLFCSIAVFLVPGFDPKLKAILVFILVALLVNAMVCGGISGVLARYQSRVVWLLTLPFMLYLADRRTSGQADRRTGGQADKATL
jgi:hypothetical protein